MDENFANFLLQKTKEDYNLIALDFSNKRSFNPPAVVKNLILKYFEIKPEKKILDWGCGHGRYYPIFEKTNYYGIDVSEELIKIAKNKYPLAKFLVNQSFLSLPFENNSFDYLICLDTLHHIPSKQYRQKFVQEAHRVLKENGLIIVTVWDLNLFHLLFSAKFKRIGFIIKSLLKKIFRQTSLEYKDAFIPWGNQCLRFVHRFSKHELKQLFRKARFKIIAAGTLKRSETNEKDFYLVAQKLNLNNKR